MALGTAISPTRARCCMVSTSSTSADEVSCEHAEHVIKGIQISVVKKKKSVAIGAAVSAANKAPEYLSRWNPMEPL
eukprot:6188845-Pleurochrysis_carterae.AAC.3